jgi:hypothetical protein
MSKFVKILLALLVVAALLLLVSEPAPETSMTVFWTAKLIALVVLVLAGRPLVTLAERRA